MIWGMRLSREGLLEHLGEPEPLDGEEFVETLASRGSTRRRSDTRRPASLPAPGLRRAVTAAQRQEQLAAIRNNSLARAYTLHPERLFYGPSSPSGARRRLCLKIVDRYRAGATAASEIAAQLLDPACNVVEVLLRANDSTTRLGTRPCH